MTRPTGPDGLLYRNGWALLTVTVLFCGLCICLNSAFLGLEPPALAGLVGAGSFIVSLAVITGTRRFRIF